MLRGTNKPGVEELSRGDETSGVTLEGNRVTGTHGRGRVRDGNSSSTRDTKGNTSTRRREEMASGMEPAAAPSALQGTSEGEGGGLIQVSMQRYYNGAGSFRPDHGVLVHSEYGLLALKGPAVDPASVGPQGTGTTLRTPNG